jgi:hypothetical protein
MAISTATNTVAATNPTPTRKTADAFLNISIVDQDGKSHRLNKGIPLNANKGLEGQLIKLLTENPDYKLELTADLFVANQEAAAIKF